MSVDSGSARSWETVYVFISSTFADMHAERDYLIKQVLPQLRDWCERRRLRLVDIDLRWGVTETDATRNKNVVKVCLDRIDECRPFFLCFLGQRYGWVPGPDDVTPQTIESFPGLAESLADHRSVTHLEILHAAMRPFHTEETRRDRGWDPAAHSFFYLRDPCYLERLPPEPLMLRRIYTDEAEPNEELRELLHDRQQALRGVAIAETGRPIRCYSAAWHTHRRTPELAMPTACPSALPENQQQWRASWERAIGVEVEGLILNAEDENAAAVFNDALTRGRLGAFVHGDEPLGEVILRDLKSAIEQRFPKHQEATYKSDLQRELDQQEQFVTAARQGFIQRTGDFDALDAYLAGNSRKPLFLTAPAGVGKSTLLANWIIRARTSLAGEQNASLHFRFIGQSDDAATVDSVLRTICEELQQTGKLDAAIPTDPAQLRDSWPQLLAAAGESGPTVVVLDALNQLESRLSDLSWLPNELGAGVKLITSFKTGEPEGDRLLASETTRSNVELAAVRPFERTDDRRQLVRAYLSQYLKELDQQHVELLIDSPGAENPLYLKVVLSELRVFGAFANLGEKVRNDFGDSPASAFEGLLRRLETDPTDSPIPPKDATAAIFGLLGHARHGLTVDELTSLLGAELGSSAPEHSVALRDAIEGSLRQVRAFLAHRDGRYDFFFESFRNAATARYTQSRPASSWHQVLASFFDGLPLFDGPQPHRRKVAELPHHLTHAEDWDELEKTLCDLRFIDAKVRAGLVHGLDDDFEAVAAAMPGGQSESTRERERIERAERFADELVAWARGDRTELDVVETVPLADEAVIDAEIERLRHNPSQRQRLDAFGNFIRTHIGELSGYRDQPSMAIQLAYNYADAGPVVETASDFRQTPNLLLARTRPPYNPHPAVVRTFVHKDGAGPRYIDCMLGRPVDRKEQALGRAVLDLDTGELVHPRLDLEPFAVSADDRLALVCDGPTSRGSDYAVRVWDLDTGQCIHALEGHEAAIQSVELSADNRLATSLSLDGQLKTWDVGGESCLHTIAVDVPDIHLHGSGRWVSQDEWSVAEPVKQHILSNGTELAVWNAERLKLYELSSGVVGRSFEHARRTHSVSPETLRAATTDPDGGCVVWDIETGAQLRNLEKKIDEFWVPHISADGRRVIGTGFLREKPLTYVWDLDTGRARPAVENCDPACITDDGRWCISNNGREARVWNLTTGECVTTLETGEDHLHATRITSDGRFALTAGGERIIRLWDVNAGTSRTLEGHGDDVRTIRFSKDGKHVISGGGCTPPRKRYFLDLREIASGQTLESVEGHTELVTEIRMTPDARAAISCDVEGMVRLWDLETKKCVAKVGGKKRFGRDLAVSENGRLASAGFADNSTQLWELPSGRKRASFNFMAKASFSPDARRLALARNSVTVWDLDSLERIRSLKDDDPIWSIQLTCDGATAITTSGPMSLDQGAKLWDLAK